MARQKTDVYWRERVRVIAANERRIGPKPIARRLADEADRLGRHDPPSERTVARILDTFRGAGIELERLYREVHWPESFDSGALPWEAGELAIALVGVEKRGRPLVRNVRWAWRITLAHPDAPIAQRWRAACYMAAWEVAPDLNPQIPQRVESWLTSGASLDDLTIDGSGPDESLEALSGALLPSNARIGAVSAKKIKEGTAP